VVTGPKICMWFQSSPANANKTYAITVQYLGGKSTKKERAGGFCCVILEEKLVVLYIAIITFQDRKGLLLP
jgi:hypothetical protein